MKENSNVTYDKAYKFAIRIVNAYKYLQKEKKEFILSKQLLRSGTSIGANIAEANGRATPRRRKAQGNARGRYLSSRFLSQNIYRL